ncbi:MAG: 2,3-bisphosphoglycerate-independent phosphoglycerate mutase [Chitinophagaceae bacterium]
MKSKKVILIIMDGWGLGKVAYSDAIQHANAPFTKSLYSKYPNTILITSGKLVGLPEGQMGNSEVGHLNLGAGRVVYQELQRINVAIEDGSLDQNEKLLSSIRYAKQNNKPFHLLGLLSDGGVHSHINHLKAIINICMKEGLAEVYIHAFTDGRDCDPKSGFDFISELQKHLDQTVGKIATITGRYYAMDRDKRWERVSLAYNALVNGVGIFSTDAENAVKESYSNNVTDEFIKPIIITNKDHRPITTIKDGDAVFCFNFRTDRCREITEVLTQKDFPEYSMKKLALHYTTMTQYDQNFKNVEVVFENDDLKNTLGEILEQHGLKQIRIAETEKYPHVSFFFSGGREVPFDGEKRIMIPSPKVATYDLKPEMSAFELTEALIPEIISQSADFICLNYANADMVGHTGVWEAAIKAVETVDKCVEKVVTAGIGNGYTIFLTADHGNSDYLINDDGSPNTAHTLNPVPFFVIDKDPNLFSWKPTSEPAKLADLAPTILTVMNLPIPPEMTGKVLTEQS